MRHQSSSSRTVLSSVCMLVVLACCGALAFAPSTFARRPNVKRIHQPLVGPVELLPRLPAGASAAAGRSDRSRRARRSDVAQDEVLGWEDEWRVPVELDGEPVVFHLAPTPDLLHPQATHRTSPDASSPLARPSLLAYSGFILPSAHSDLAWSVARHSSAPTNPFDEPAESLGWVRLIVPDAERQTFRGSFMLRGEMWHVAPSETYVAESNSLDVQPSSVDNLVFFRDSDVDKSSTGCAHDKLDFNVAHDHPVHVESGRRRRRREEGMWWMDGMGGSGSGDFLEGGVSFGREGLMKRQDAGGELGSNLNFTATIGNTNGCPTSQRVVYMGVAADCQYVRQKGGADEARNAILNNWNLASGLYRSTFNVSLGIVELYVPSSTNSSCTSSPAVASEAWNVDCSTLTLNDRLSAFSTWRGAERSGDQAGLWHLMSGCPTGQEVGVAWLGQLCSQNSRNQGSSGVVSGTAVSTYSPTEWQVVSHETGHNFGAVHDCTESTCGGTGSQQCCPLEAGTCPAGGRFIMSPVSSQGEENFSQCSIGNVCSAMLNNAVDASCLATPGGVTTISENQCGNGILEPGEDCDPGGTNSTCCDPDTCKFRNGAQCDPASSPCCLDTCSFSPASVVCRPSVGECDIAETCSGSSADCPDDKTVNDGTSCGNSSSLYCASGTCTSRDLQCRTVGASLGITSACSGGLSNGDSCTLTCNNPNGGGCLSLQSTFSDGTSCGGGQGRCSNGSCSYGSGLARAKGWYLDHLNIAIPVTVVVGLIVLAILYFVIRAIYRCCARPRRPRTGQPPVVFGSQRSSANTSMTDSSGRPIMTQSVPPGFVPQGAYGQQPYPPPPARQAPGQWVDPSAYNGPNYRR